MSVNALVVDDDRAILEEIADMLVSLGHEFDLADSVESAREFLKSNEYTYVLLDLEIPIRAGKNLPRRQFGESLLEEIRQARGARSLPAVIIITAHGTDGPELAVDLMTVGAADFVPKPFKSHGRTLESRIRKVLASLAIDEALSPRRTAHRPGGDRSTLTTLG